MGWLNKLFNLDSFKAVSESEGFGSSTSSQTGANKPPAASGSSASKRLKLVLMHDRTLLSPAMMEQMRDELVDVISRYVVIDKSALDINLESESNTIALVANIPVLRTRSGIDETLTQQQLVQPSEVLPNAVNRQPEATAAAAPQPPKQNTAATPPATGNTNTLPSQQTTQQSQPFANTLSSAKPPESTTF